MMTWNPLVATCNPMASRMMYLNLYLHSFLSTLYFLLQALLLSLYLLNLQLESNTHIWSLLHFHL